MKKILGWVIVVIVFTSCHYINGNGKIVSEKRQTGSFTGLTAGGAFEVEIKTGPVSSVVVEADDNLLPYIETEVRSNVLHINSRSRYNIGNGHFKIYIIVPEINYINVSGAANIKAINILKSDDKIELKTSGAAQINAEVDAPVIEAATSGAGNIDLRGRTKNYFVKCSGSGNVNSKNLLSETAEVKVSGAGTANVYASINLNAKASGAGTVHYSGAAAVQQHTSGAGSIVKED